MQRKKIKIIHNCRAGTEPETSWFLVRFVNHCTTTGTPTLIILKEAVKGDHKRSPLGPVHLAEAGLLPTLAPANCLTLIEL